jgi:transmembrane sensor
LAAALLLASVVAGLAILWRSREVLLSGFESGETRQFASDFGSPSTITLSDGSVVTLNRDTLLETRFSASHRRVRLIRGQAFFAVAKNPARPFSVEATGNQVIAVGTEFGIRLDGERMEVVLLQGKLSVEPSGFGIDWLLNRRQSVQLLPDMRLVANGKATSIASANAASLLSWRHGWVVFENDSLADVVTELNRYSVAPILLSDSSVASMRLSGVFKIGQPARFAATIREVLPVTTDQDTAGRIIVRSAQK